MIKVTFYAKYTEYTPTTFEAALSRRFEGWTHLIGLRYRHSVLEQFQTYIVIFSDYPDFRIDLKYLASVLKRELSQDEVLVTIENVEVL